MQYYFANMYGNTLRNYMGLYGRLFRIPERSKDRIAIFEKLTAKTWYSYRFDDGWWVGIEFKKIDSEKEYKKLKKKVCGDLGYGWMIDNIIDHDSPRDVDAKYMNEVLLGEHLDS